MSMIDRLSALGDRKTNATASDGGTITLNKETLFVALNAVARMTLLMPDNPVKGVKFEPGPMNIPNCCTLITVHADGLANMIAVGEGDDGWQAIAELSEDAHVRLLRM